MKKVSSTLLLMLSLLLLCSCGKAQPPKDAIWIQVTQNTDAEIENLAYLCALDGKTIESGAVQNADNTPLKIGETITLSLTENFFPGGSDLNAFSLQVGVSVSNGETINAEETLSFPVAYGQCYQVSLTGNAQDGYHIALNSDSTTN